MHTNSYLQEEKEKYFKKEINTIYSSRWKTIGVMCLLEGLGLLSFSNSIGFGNLILILLIGIATTVTIVGILILVKKSQKKFGGIIVSAKIDESSFSISTLDGRNLEGISKNLKVIDEIFFEAKTKKYKSKTISISEERFFFLEDFMISV